LKAAVVDTNVLIVANENCEQADPECVLACVNALEGIKQKRITLLDSGMRIFDEYRRHTSLSGQPGLGDSFMKWLWTNHAHPRRCRLIDITPKPSDPEDFEEFPNDPALEGFDRADKKFVAVALASHRQPRIINATDSDWWHFRRELRDHGVTIEFLCPQLMNGAVSGV
jgi:hypothetical protein